MEAARDLGPSLRGGELNYVCDKATLEELKVALEVVRDQRLTRLTYTTKLTPAIVQKDVDTFAKARDAGSRALFSAYVLERTCMVVGERTQKSLKELNLEGMPVGRWLKILNLNSSSSLNKLSLRHCRIGDDGCKVLQKSGLTSTLKEMDLTGNNLTDNGAQELARLLGSQSFRRVIDPEFQGLEKLTINYNDIGTAGLNAIVDVLLNDFWIKAVEMRSCRISSTGDSLRLALVNRVIEVFDLRDNPVTDGGVVYEVARVLTTRHPLETSNYTWKDRDNLLNSAAETENE